MSQKLGKVTPVAVGQVVFEDNVVHVRVLKNANETKVRTAFLDYYKAYKVNPPSIKVKLWQPEEWEAIEFEEEAELGGADEADDEADTAGDGDAPAGGSDKPSDLVTLTNELRSLILRIPEAKGAGPAVLDQLKKLAGEAGVAIKRNDAAGATAGLAQLRNLLAAAAKAAADAQGKAAPATPGAPQAGGKQQMGDDLLATFRDAKDEVDAGLNKLQEALRETEDPDMLRIAELGLYGLTGERGLTVGLTRALLDLRSAAPDARAAKMKAARDAATAYKTAVLAEGAMVDLVDKNPFNVTVGIRSKLVAALDTIANAA
jgi:hypothetical protein